MPIECLGVDKIIIGARYKPPALPATHPPILGRHTTSTSTGKSAVSTHVRRCCPARTLKRSGRPIFVSRLQPHHAPRLNTSLQQYRPSRRQPTYDTRPLIITGGSARSPPTPKRPPTTSSASWTNPDRSSPSSLLRGTLRLLEWNVTRGAFKLVKVGPFSRELYATSTSLMESNLPTPSRLLDVMVGSRLVLVVSSQVIRVWVLLSS